MGTFYISLEPYSMDDFIVEAEDYGFRVATPEECAEFDIGGHQPTDTVFIIDKSPGEQRAAFAAPHGPRPWFHAWEENPAGADDQHVGAFNLPSEFYDLFAAEGDDEYVALVHPEDDDDEEEDRS